MPWGQEQGVGFAASNTRCLVFSRDPLPLTAGLVDYPSPGSAQKGEV